MDNTSIKNNIRNKRKERKFTQEEVAHQLGISLTAYRDIEKGGTSIVNSNLIRIADLLETTTEELVLGYRPSQEHGVLHTGHETLILDDLQEVADTVYQRIVVHNIGNFD